MSKQKIKRRKLKLAIEVVVDTDFMEGVIGKVLADAGRAFLGSVSFPGIRDVECSISGVTNKDLAEYVGKQSTLSIIEERSGVV